MGKLYQVRQLIEKTIKDRHLDEFQTKGQIGLKSGLMISFLKPETPDDEAKFSALKKAVKEVLGIDIH